MGLGIIRWVLAALLVAFSNSHLLAQQRNQGGGSPEQRVALVIGNSSYKESPLRNPVNDATDMAATLRSLGFAVTLRTNADTRQMRAAIREFAQNLKRGGVGLFYFAGHGVQSRSGKNYLIPVGADLKEEFELEDEAVDANRVLSGMEEAGNRVNIVILDACRNNPFARSWRSAVSGLAQMSAPAGSFVGFATAPGQVAADGSGRNGIYTKYLLENLKQGDPDIDRVFTRVTAAVAKETGNKQVPWKSSSLTGDFYFRPSEKASSNASLALPSAPASGEFSLDDLRKQQENRAQWDNWQQEMKAAFDQTAALALAPDLKAAAWARFISNYSQDNPNSSESTALRAEAKKRKQQAEADGLRQNEESSRKRREAAQIATIAPSGASTQAQFLTGTLKKISDTGAITIGFRGTSIPFSYLDENRRPIGYAIDLCMKVVDAIKAELNLPNLRIIYQPVEASNRVALLQNGTIDLECGATTNSVQRQQLVSFGPTYFVINVTAAVKKRSGIQSIADLAGKTIDTTSGTSAIGLLKSYQPTRNAYFNEIYGKDHSESFLLMANDRSAAFIMDDILLAGQIANAGNPAEFRILPDSLRQEPYSMVLRKDDPQFKALVDKTISNIMKSGEIEIIYAKWFTSPIPPKGINLNFPITPAIRRALSDPNDRGVY